jgi:hypothetical protein
VVREKILLHESFFEKRGVQGYACVEFKVICACVSFWCMPRLREFLF